MQHRWRVYMPDAGRGSATELRLSDDEAHHVRRVLRLRAGGSLGVFDGEGAEWSATITRLGAEGVWVRLGSKLEDAVDCALEVALFQGWCEPARMEWILQKGTELGLASIHPLPKPGAARAPSGQRLRRWRRIAVEACKQSGRRRVPRIEPRSEPGAPPGGTLALLLDPGEGAAPLGGSLGHPPPARVWLATGPAEGWEPAAVDALRTRGWSAVGLGPRTLRAETAGLAAATIVLHRYGDLGSGGR